MQVLFSKWFRDVDPDADSADVPRRKPPAKELNVDRGNLIRGKRIALNESQDIFGERFGVQQVTVSRWEKGEIPARKYWNRVARLLNRTINDLFVLEDIGAGEVGHPSNLGLRPLPDIATMHSAAKDGEIPLSIIPVDGTVGAGAWVDVLDYHIEMEPINAPRDRTFEGARQMAFLVEGDSMELAGIPDGFYVTCVSFPDSGLGLKTGMIIVVEQSRDGGQLKRRVVKEVHVFRDRYELRSHSNNPAHQTITLPIDYFDEPKEEITVIAAVFGVWKKVAV